MPQLYSNCCYAEMHTLYTPPTCPACKEGCGVEEGELLNCEVDKENLLPTKKEMEKWLEDSYEPRVGDRVSVEGEVVSVYTTNRPRCDVKLLLPNITLVTVPVEDLARAKLLSRKTRTLTKVEAEALLTEKLGEQITIE